MNAKNDIAVDLVLTEVRNSLENGRGRGYGFASGLLSLRIVGSEWGALDLAELVAPLLEVAAAVPSTGVTGTHGGLMLTVRWDPPERHRPDRARGTRVLVALAIASGFVPSSERMFDELRAALLTASRTVKQRPDRDTPEMQDLEASMLALIESLKACGVHLDSDQPPSVEQFLAGDRATAVRLYGPDDLKAMFKAEAGHVFDDFDEMREFAERVRAVAKVFGVAIRSKPLGVSGTFRVSGRRDCPSFSIHPDGSTTVTLRAGARTIPNGLTLVPKR